MLDYNQPIDRARSEAPQQRSRTGFDVLELVSLLWRRKIAIAAAALLGATLAVTIGKSLTPRYTATAQLLTDTKRSHSAPDTPGAPVDSAVVESQIETIKSEKIALAVIGKLGLDKDPEFIEPDVRRNE